MRYLVRARVRPGRHEALLEAIEQKRLGRGSVAEGEYLRNMRAARVAEDGTIKWVEVCYCATPLDEERPYWERYFELTRVQDAHDRARCRHENGTERWSCEGCDCSERLEGKLAKKGESFLAALRRMAVRPRAPHAPEAARDPSLTPGHSSSSVRVRNPGTAA